MKVNEIKHNHTLTEILKFSIFSLLMLAPMINVGVRSAYVISNKNAYQSYSGKTQAEEIYTQTSLTNLKPGDFVYYNNNNQVQIQREGQDLVIKAHDITLNNVTYNNADTVQFYAYPASPNSNTLYVVVKEGQNTLISRNVMQDTYTLTFYYENYNNNASINYVNGITNLYVITYNQNSYLDNVFEYSVSQLEESSLYNWVETTGIYSTFNTMNTQLSITNTAIALLLSYWFLLTVIYVIIDIIIKVFTTVTHMIGIKTA